mmetsp:Transcript_106123/g.338001  ORF Transcript_106123/g.338001 Transcript_106123/m.338001 type:complete len:298 (+) Transcript_106123:846-1739(+)
MRCRHEGVEEAAELRSQLGPLHAGDGDLPVLEQRREDLVQVDVHVQDVLEHVLPVPLHKGLLVGALGSTGGVGHVRQALRADVRCHGHQRLVEPLAGQGIEEEVRQHLRAPGVARALLHHGHELLFGVLPVRLQHAPLVLGPLHLCPHQCAQDAEPEVQVRRVEEGNAAAAEPHAQLRQEAGLLRQHRLVQPPHRSQHGLLGGHLRGAVGELEGQHRGQVPPQLGHHGAREVVLVPAEGRAVVAAESGAVGQGSLPRLTSNPLRCKLSQTCRLADLEEVVGNPGVLPVRERLLAQQG